MTGDESEVTGPFCREVMTKEPSIVTGYVVGVDHDAGRVIVSATRPAPEEIETRDVTYVRSKLLALIDASRKRR